MNTKTLLFLFFLAVSFLLPAQNLTLENFTRLESGGEIPDDFKKFITAKEDNSDNNTYLKEMFLSGKIVYGNEINQYINTIADNLLKDYPELRQELRFYVVKSPSVNAFATQNGIIFVNLGLIAQVSNEAELAFVMAHEIVHYVEDHVLKINDYLKKNKDSDHNSYFLSYHHRSREQEVEADELALKRYFKSSNYSYSVLNGVFDVLQYAYLPFDEIPFDRSFVEESFYQFPEKYYLDVLKPIRSREDYIDTLQTHPNIQKRRQSTQAIIRNLDDSGRKTFIQPEALFNKIRDLARFECINQYITNHDYGDAIYNTYVLQKTHPDNQFLDIAMAAAMYGFHKHKMSGGVSDVLSSYKEVEGEKQQVHYFFSRLNRKESNALAMRYLWKIHLKYPQNEFLNTMCEDAAKDLMTNNKMSYIDFSDYPMGTPPDSIRDETPAAPADTATKTTQNKYSRIKQQTQGQQTKVKPSEKFTVVNYMLVDLKQDEAFMSLLENAIRAKEDENVQGIISEKKKADIGKIVIWRPLFYSLKKRYDETQLDYKKSEKGAVNIEKTIRYSVKKLKIDNFFYTKENIANFNTNEYNSFVRLQEWFHDYYCSQDVTMTFYQSQDIDNVIDAIGTRHLNFIATVTRPSRFMDSHKLYSFILGASCVVYFPFAVVEFAMPKYSTTVAFAIIDIKTGKTEFSNGFSVSSEMKDAYINSGVYDSYHQLKKRNKTKK